MSSSSNSNRQNSNVEAGDSGDVSTSKPVSKFIRVVTVFAYLSGVSTAAIMLSLYYIFLWNPAPNHNH